MLHKETKFIAAMRLKLPELTVPQTLATYGFVLMEACFKRSPQRGFSCGGVVETGKLQKLSTIELKSLSIIS